MRNLNLITSKNEMLNQYDFFNKVAAFPAVNISETEKTIHIVLELPGYKPEDISVHSVQTRLFVSGSRNENYSGKERMHLSTERIASFRWVHDLKTTFNRKDLMISLESGYLFIMVLKTEVGMRPVIEIPIVENYMEDNVYFPRANVVETENHIEMSLEIPGYENEDVSIKIINSSLVIKGKRALALYDKKQIYHRVEIPFRNSFVRRFELPEYVNHTQASWKVQHGVLFFYLPKLKTIKKEEVSRETMVTY